MPDVRIPGKRPDPGVCCGGPAAALSLDRAGFPGSTAGKLLRTVVRPKGTRNTEYNARRAKLLGHLRRELKAGGTHRPTLRELARACGCSVSTLNNYFGRRNDIVQVVFKESRGSASQQIANTRTTDLAFEESIRRVAGNAWAPFANRGVARTLALGMVEGLGSAPLGAAYINEMFDPFILALAERLSSHVAT